MEPLRIGIVGAGGITALLHVPALRRLGDRVEVTWLCGRKRHRLEHLRDQLGGRPRLTDDWRRMVAEDDVDAVIIATPHPLHVAPGLAAVAAGRHVLMQKPLCGDLAEADAFANAAAASDRTILVMPHVSATVLAARRLIDAGAIGTPSGALSRHSHGGPEVYYAEVRDAFGEPPADDLWFFDADQADVGALFDMGVYAVATLVTLLGRAVEVVGRTATVAKPTPMEDTATLLISFANGALGTAETGWVDPARTSYFRVHGTGGKLIAPGEAGAPLTLWEPTSTTREHAPPRATPIDIAADGPGDVHEHWLACIAAGIQPPHANAATARHVTEILLGGLESARTGRAVAVRSGL